MERARQDDQGRCAQAVHCHSREGRPRMAKVEPCQALISSRWYIVDFFSGNYINATWEIQYLICVLEDAGKWRRCGYRSLDTFYSRPISNQNRKIVKTISHRHWVRHHRMPWWTMCIRLVNRYKEGRKGEGVEDVAVVRTLVRLGLLHLPLRGLSWHNSEKGTKENNKIEYGPDEWEAIAVALFDVDQIVCRLQRSVRDQSLPR